MVPARSKQIWTSAEEDYLAEKWGVIPTTSIAENLSRSLPAVQEKAWELGLGKTLLSGEYITLYSMVSEILGTSDGHNIGQVAKRWIAAGLPYKRQRIVTAKIKVVRLDSWWRWAEQHKHLTDFSKFEENALGKEPAWVKEKRRADSRNALTCPRYSLWTPEEEARLSMLLNRRLYTMAQISAKMHRSAGSIRHKQQRLGLPAPVPEQKFVHIWSAEDDRTMENGILALKSWTVIGMELARNTEAVKQRARRVYGTVDQDAIRAILAEREKERENAGEK